MLQLFKQMVNAFDQGQRQALVTAINAGPGLNRLIGRKWIVNSDTGAVEGEPEAPSEVVQEALDCLEKGEPQTVVKQISSGDWLEIFIEPLSPPSELLILGGGHIAKPLVVLGKLAGFEVTVIDDRPSFANRDRFPEADRVICLDFVSALKRTKIGPNTYVVIVTRGHRHDSECLNLCIGRSAAYLGMIGSKRRIKIVLESLHTGDPEVKLSRVHAPIGLDIGACTPEEIAISIMAEVILVRRGGSGTALSSSSRER